MCRFPFLAATGCGKVIPPRRWKYRGVCLRPCLRWDWRDVENDVVGMSCIAREKGRRFADAQGP
jgi:hypothetical protein